MAEPLTFEAAEEFVRGRRLLPTVLNAAELAGAFRELPPGAQMQAFYSARVSSSSVLGRILKTVEAYANGEIDLATARADLKLSLVDQGFSADDVGMTGEPPPGVDEDDWKARRSITNLASTRRLNLILDTQARMAWAVGRRQVSEHPAVLDRWPYYRYIRSRARVPRPDHAALDGLTLAKTDPFWATHTPPWGYGCQCDIEDADEAEAQAAGGVGRAAAVEERGAGSEGGQSPAEPRTLSDSNEVRRLPRVSGNRVASQVYNPANGQVVEITENPSGFVFDANAALSPNPDAYDWAQIENATLRGMARSEAEEMQERA